MTFSTDLYRNLRYAVWLLLRWRLISVHICSSTKSCLFKALVYGHCSSINSFHIQAQHFNAQHCERIFSIPNFNSSTIFYFLFSSWECSPVKALHGRIYAFVCLMSVLAPKLSNELDHLLLLDLYVISLHSEHLCKLLQGIHFSIFSHSTVYLTVKPAKFYCLESNNLLLKIQIHGCRYSFWPQAYCQNLTSGNYNNKVIRSAIRITVLWKQHGILDSLKRIQLIATSPKLE